MAAKTNYLQEAKKRFLEGTKFRTPIEAVEAGYRSAGEWCDTLASVRSEMGSRDERDRNNLEADADGAAADDLY
jgi:hypothetical protein